MLFKHELSVEYLRSPVAPIGLQFLQICLSACYQSQLGNLKLSFTFFQTSETELCSSSGLKSTWPTGATTTQVHG